MDELANTRPKLKQSSVFLQTQDGVFFQGDGTMFRLKGQSIGKWISILSPHLTGEYTLDELCERLEPTQREMVSRLVATLLQKGVLKNELPEAPGVLPDEVRQQFREQIEFIDHYVDYPQQHFKDFRESRILLVGSGESLLSLAASLVRNGLKNLFLAPTDAANTYLEALEPEVAPLHQNGCEVHISLFDGNLQSIVANLRTYNSVTYCSDTGSLKDIMTLNQYCRNEGCTFLPVTLFAGQAMIGPFVRPQQGGCWLCAQMRLATNSDSFHSAALWRELVLGKGLSIRETPLFKPVARRIGNGVSFELFKILSGTLPSETEGGVIFQEVENLESSHGKLVQHPLCPVCSHLDPDLYREHLQAIVTGKRDHNLDYEELYARCTSLIDAHLGVFNRFADEDIQQIPLKRTKIIVGHPESSLASTPLDVTTCSLQNVLTTYPQALMEAVKHYTLALADKRGMISASLREMQMVRGETGETIAAQRLSTWSGVGSPGQDTPIQWMLAFSVFTQKFTYVPAAAVYPLSQLNHMGLFEKTTAGAATGMTFSEVLSSGILSALAYDCLCEFTRGTMPAMKLDLAELALSDADLTFLIKSALRFERSLTFLEVLQNSPLSLVIACTTDTSAGAIVATGYGLSGLEAVKNALLELVGRLQILRDEGTLPVTLQTLLPEFSPYVAFPSGDSRRSRLHESAVTMQQVEDALKKSGRDILFVNTTTCDIWETEALMSGKVLLTRPVDEEEQRQ
ncbi:MAG TPA: TOMM precursor leader peptide-binding protein [Ktedonobacteraceae bacterium]|nr:TOMM precursor leader peptide-binding protein [Ktedonobacteraceae bacterium]